MARIMNLKIILMFLLFVGAMFGLFLLMCKLNDKDTALTILNEAAALYAFSLLSILTALGLSHVAAKFFL